MKLKARRLSKARIDIKVKMINPKIILETINDWQHSFLSGKQGEPCALFASKSLYTSLKSFRASESQYWVRPALEIAVHLLAWDEISIKFSLIVQRITFIALARIESVSSSVTSIVLLESESSLYLISERYVMSHAPDKTCLRLSFELILKNLPSSCWRILILPQ